jgi:hypothetical protein
MEPDISMEEVEVRIIGLSVIFQGFEDIVMRAYSLVNDLA